MCGEVTNLPRSTFMIEVNKTNQMLEVDDEDETPITLSVSIETHAPQLHRHAMSVWLFL